MSLRLLQEQAGLTGKDVDGVFGPTTFWACKEYLDLPSDIASVHFFAQCGHETGNFQRFEENLNYSKEGLLSTFGKYFDDESAEAYARQPEKIANRVYANRMSNGDEESGDGWKYRGRGAIQLTGRFNYKEFAEYMNDIMIVRKPKRVSEELSFMAACWFFDANGIFDICTDLSYDTVKKITKKINGGYNGLNHRLELTEKYAKYI
tara:strand:- start:5313 stop:5930 length:618 start_codon:yes stop_codon:yes gene_type:complete